ncbi:hypothetical protein Baya_14096 [Bagarius yarrelli]|uniref:Uncharacterized protein n=1 Tax=Bagarius yarrelli TaxID=175774 RepID=A0A556V7T3_BAGYA|nr:hypothetical protein Baya_14096 [Bagarius yarrelli]
MVVFTPQAADWLNLKRADLYSASCSDSVNIHTAIWKSGSATGRVAGSQHEVSNESARPEAASQGYVLPPAFHQGQSRKPQRRGPQLLPNQHSAPVKCLTVVIAWSANATLALRSRTLLMIYCGQRHSTHDSKFARLSSHQSKSDSRHQPSVTLPPFSIVQFTNQQP